MTSRLFFLFTSPHETAPCTLVVWQTQLILQPMHWGRTAGLYCNLLHWFSLASVHSSVEISGCGRLSSVATRRESHMLAQGTCRKLFYSTDLLEKSRCQAYCLLFTPKRKPSSVDRLKATSLHATYYRCKFVIKSFFFLQISHKQS